MTFLTPDTLSISGPEPLIDSISRYYTEQVHLENVTQDITQEIKLLPAPHPAIHLSADKVKFYIPVVEYTEGTIEIPITVITPSPEDSFVIYPKKITITYKVSLNDYNKVTSELFEATADFTKIDMSGDNKINVTIEKYPSFVKNINYTPKDVEYIIYK